MVMQNFIKFLKFITFIYFVLCTSINAKTYKPGEIINNGEFEITKKFKINLSPGTWTILRTEEHKWGYFDFRIFGAARIENNKVIEFWEVVWGDMGVRLQGQIDPLIYSAVFKDKLKCYKCRDGVCTPLNIIDDEKRIKYEDIASHYSEGHED